VLRRYGGNSPESDTQTSTFPLKPIEQAPSDDQILVYPEKFRARA
jgi:hypothetical protein